MLHDTSLTGELETAQRSTRAEVSAITTPHLQQLRDLVAKYRETIPEFCFDRDVVEASWDKIHKHFKINSAAHGYTDEAIALASKTIKGYFDAYMDVFEIGYQVHRKLLRLTPLESFAVPEQLEKAKAELNLQAIDMFQEAGLPIKDSIHFLSEAIKVATSAAGVARDEMNEVIGPHNPKKNTIFVRPELAKQRFADPTLKGDYLRELELIVKESEAILGIDKKSPAR